MKNYKPKSLVQQTSKPKFLFISGSNLDKRHQGEINQIINRDKDIHKLIQKAYLTRPRVSTLIIFVSIIFFLLPATYSGVDAIKKFIDGPTNKLILYSILLLCILNSLHSLIVRIVRVIIEMKSLWTYIQVRYIKRLLPKKPLDLWHIFHANITDGQIALYAQRLLDGSNPEKANACKLVYAGEPYMSHYLLDSIDIDWRFGKQTRLFKRYQIRRHFRYFFRQFAIQSVYANATDKMNKIYNTNNPIRQTSNYVFGLMFASRYFSCFLKKFYKHKEKVCIDISDIKKHNQPLIKNIMQHLTSPYHFDIIDDKNKLVDKHLVLHINQFSITFPISEKEKNKWYLKLMHFPKRLSQSAYNMITAKKSIHIPIKRLFLKSSNETGEPFLLDQLDAVDEDTIILLGGAEQSLPQCHLINRHRWMINPSKETKIGFAENEFDSSDSEHYKFYVGTEGFVYGRYMNQIIAPDDNPNKSKRDYAEKLHIMLDHKDILILYGYHAISTKIIAAKYLLDYLRLYVSNNSTELERCIFHHGYWCLMITYRYSIDQQKTSNKEKAIDQQAWNTLKNHWDKHNPLDNLTLTPQTDLNTIKTETIDVLISQHP